MCATYKQQCKEIVNVTLNNHLDTLLEHARFHWGFEWKNLPPTMAVVESMRCFKALENICITPSLCGVPSQ